MLCKIFKFRLFVAGDTQNSIRAAKNLAAICAKHLSGLYEIETVDVFREPKRALADGILMTPTLIRVSPGLPLRIIGTLSDPEKVLNALGLEGVTL